MKNHACIIIGIDEYDFLKALSYAKQDAQALENFLLEQAGFAPDRCWLLTATSPPVDSHPTYPNRQNILERIEDLCRHRLHSGDVLWLFFRGWGQEWQGEDYLMPIEGKPDDIPGTGISVRSLLDILKSSPAETVVVLLDVNRALADSAGEGIGSNTVKLAAEMEIPTLLSLQSHQVSSNLERLQNGLFATALLEGLRLHRCQTLASLEAFLSDRLPSLCAEYDCPPIELRVAFNPPEKRHLEILPEIGETSSNQWANSAVPISLTAERLTVAPSEIERELAAAFAPAASETTDLASPVQPPVAAFTNGKVPSENPAPSSEERSDSNGTAANLPAAPSTPTASERRSFGIGSLVMGSLWAGLAAVLVLAGWIALNPWKFESQQSDKKPASQAPVASKPVQPSQAEKPVAPPAKPAASDKNNQPKAASPSPAVAIAPVQPSEPSYERVISDISRARKIPQGDPAYAGAQENINRWAAVLLEIAIGRAKQGKYQQAIAAAKQVPPERGEISDRARELTSVWQQQYQLQQVNYKRLQEAKKLIRPRVASSYNKAIAAARQIKAGEPQYQPAQKLIEAWSEEILKIARNRRARGRIRGAILAATLVPEGTQAYPAAQKALEQWQRKR